MHAFEVLGDPVRRRILEVLAGGERQAGEVGAVVHAEFGISQPAVSLQLRILREQGFATVRAVGARRLYAIDRAPLQEVEGWLGRFREISTGWPAAPDAEPDPGRRSGRLKTQMSTAATETKKRKKRSKRKGHKA
ncbi:MAG TPA: metalloregulator ArsR/SmtB family transcription factor [Candidatus Limnocylindrales bacterium]|nr:metalloregulator ArsR/SmtB family transcription factor [Candidatus Limnocylindrales bacterium]